MHVRDRHRRERTKPATRSGRRCVRLVGLLLVVLLLAPRWTRAQFSKVRAVSAIEAGRATNVFARWDGDSAIDGVRFGLPEGFRLAGVWIQSASGESYEAGDLVRLESEDVRAVYRVESPRPVGAGTLLIARVVASSSPGRYRWRLAPFRRPAKRDTSAADTGADAPEGGRAAAFRDSTIGRWTRTSPIEVGRVQSRPGQQALSFDPDSRARPTLEDAGEPFRLGLEQSYTVELWLRTVELGEVVLSTWSGRESSSYPLELVVDRVGRLVCYRGESQLHHSLRSPEPLADGTWHHVAVSHDRSAGWVRLMIDGQPVDSLRIDDGVGSVDPRPLALGGRPAGRWDDGVADYGPLRPYTGEIEAVRVWDRVRSPSAVERDLHRILGASGDGLTGLTFDGSEPERGLRGAEESMRFVPSDLAFLVPVQDFRATVSGREVTLTWRAGSEGEGEFVVERSPDGESYRSVARLPVRSSEGIAADRLDRYEVRDPIGSEGVAYYRLRRLGPDGRQVGTARELKLGLGREEQPEERASVDLMGNFPNPFNGSTIIKYELRESRHVQLEVWDVSGHRIATLVDGVQDAGLHEVPFRADEIPSGMYLARLDTEDRTQTHTMILMK